MKNSILHSLILAIAVYSFSMIALVKSIFKKHIILNKKIVCVGLLFGLLGFSCLTTNAQTTVFTDNYNRATLSPGGTPSMTYTPTVATGVTAATVASSYLSVASGTSPTPVNGVSYVTGVNSTFSSPFTSTLANNVGVVTWTFNLRWNRAASNNPAEPASGAYASAVVLAGSSATLTTGTGYAIIYGNSGTPDPIRLVAYSSGVNGAVATKTNICTSGASDIANTNNYASIRVTYDPATNNWSLFIRDDGTLGWADPSSGVTSQKGVTTANSTYTSTALNAFGVVWSHATGTSMSTDFDNYKVIVTPPTPTTTSISPTFATAGGSGFTLTVNGTGFVNGLSTVTWGGSNRTTAFVNSTQLTATISAADIASTGTVNVGVTTTGAVASSNTQSFSINSGATPTINSSPASLTSFGKIVAGQSSSEQSFTVSGSNLTTDISVIAPAGVEITTTSGSYTGITGNTLTLTQTGGTVGSTTIYAEFKPATATGAYSNTITSSSTGATSQTVGVSGTAIDVEPTVQRSISFGTITTSSIVVNFSNTNAGNGAKRIVLAKTTDVTGADVPVDATTYTANSVFGSGSTTTAGTFVVYAGTGNTVTVTGLAGGTKYHFAVFEYNDNSTAGAENYLTTAPGKDSATTTTASYTWSGGSGVWTTAANWTPTRTTPGATDILQFTGGTYTITGVPTETDGQLLISNATVNLQSSATNTLTISGGTGTDLSVDASSSLNLNGSSPLTISLNTGTTGSISGNVTFTNAAHVLKAASASGITFQSGSVFNASTGFTGTAFGTTTANSVVFTSGSEYIQGAGSNPFNLGQPASIVIFNHGSTYLLTALATPSFSGRTYGNFVYNPGTTGTNPNATGGAALNVDTFTIMGGGTFNLGMTGTFNIKGNLIVASGSTLNFTAASGTDTISLSGLVPQTITNLGTISYLSTESLGIVNASGVSLGSDFNTGNLILKTGTLSIGNNTLTIAGAVSGSGTLKGSSSSNLTITGAAGSLNFTSGSRVLKNLLLGAGATATLGTALDITAGSSSGSVVTGTGATLTTSGNLTIKSDINGTAWVGTSTGTINGDVTVERYIPANSQRAWRLLSIPTQTGQSIHQSWQENQAPGVVGTTGLGTNITSPIPGNGFDYVTYHSSMLKYNQGNNSWDSVTNTGDNIATTSGYFLYIRGDRNETPSVSTGPTSATTLRTIGGLYQGDQSAISVPAGEFGLIGNVYASAIDFTKLTKGAGIDNLFYVWDPKVLNLPPSLGAYVTFSSVTTPSFIPVPGGGSYTTGVQDSLIQSGEAFFVHASSTDNIQLTESSKVTGSQMVFRPEGPSNISGQLATNLYEVNGTSASLADGNVEVFNSAYSDKVDGYDALKLSNTQENFGILRNNKVLIIEARQPVATTDTIFFDMWNMKQQQYKLEFIPTNLNTAAITGVLEDSYLGTRTPINLTTTNSINFSVDGNAGSSVSNRFRIVFNGSSPVPVTFTSVSAYQKDGAGVEVEWKVAGENGIQQYVVEHSTDGVNFTKIGVVTAKNNNGGSVNYNLLDGKATNGANYYRISSVAVNGYVKYTSIVKVTLGSTAPGIAIYPNPVTDGHITVELKNQPAGSYTVRLLNTAGQLVYKTELAHGGGSSAQSMSVSPVLAKGVYQLEIVTPGNSTHTEKVIIK